ncbi:MAG: hypothetical protein KAZ87_02500 [Spirochaetes bacterium]|nr:hypothetical protein [Spirochaetota bacterium]
MSSVSLSGSFEDKIKNISDYLKSSVINPAESEKAAIIASAKADADKIIADARAEAAKLLDDAKIKAKHEEATLESALRIASKKALDVLKSAIENELLKNAADLSVKSALSSADVIKPLVSELIKAYVSSGNKDEAEIVLSDDLKKNLSEFVKSEIVKSAEKKLSLSDSKISGGFSLYLKDKKLSLEFSDESIASLLSDQLRSEMRKYLFGN